jgi:hypothetical protein
VTFEATLHKLGIYDQLQPKITRAKGGAAAMALTAKGQVEIGVTFLSEMLDPGIDVVGPLPTEIAPPTTLVSAHAKDAAAAKGGAYLSARDVAVVYRAHGKEPGGKPPAHIADHCK